MQKVEKNSAARNSTHSPDRISLTVANDLLISKQFQQCLDVCLKCITDVKSAAENERYFSVGDNKVITLETFCCMCNSTQLLTFHQHC